MVKDGTAGILLKQCRTDFLGLKRRDLMEEASAFVGEHLRDIEDGRAECTKEDLDIFADAVLNTREVRAYRELYDAVVLGHKVRDRSAGELVRELRMSLRQTPGEFGDWALWGEEHQRRIESGEVTMTRVDLDMLADAHLDTEPLMWYRKILGAIERKEARRDTEATEQLAARQSQCESERDIKVAPPRTVHTPDDRPRDVARRIRRWWPWILAPLFIVVLLGAYAAHWRSPADDSGDNASTLPTLTQPGPTPTGASTSGVDQPSTPAPASRAPSASRSSGALASGAASKATSRTSLPFVDTFNSGLRSEWQTFGGDWRVTDGTLTNQATDGRSFIWVGSPTWTDYVVDVDIIWQRGASVSAGVNVRSGGNTGMAFAVSATDSTWWRLGNASGEDCWHLGHADLPDGPIHLRIVVQDDTYQAFLGDSDPIKRDISDSTYANGFVELWSSGQVRFDNFRVSAI